MGKMHGTDFLLEKQRVNITLVHHVENIGNK
jgi:hypothetical protein